MSEVGAGSGMTGHVQGAVPPGGWRRWAGPALLVSLMFNLLFLGAAAGSFLHGRPHAPHGPEGRGLGGYVRSLPADRSAPLLSELETGWKKAEAERRRIRSERRGSLQDYVAGDVSETELNAVLDRVGQSERALHATNRAAFIAFVAKLTADERKGFKAWLARQPRREQRPHDHH